ncbi:hypothetical protein M2138_001926 [Dysgonomonadaceae bacterium PH5-43]|nr:hypothetical protein [Dysgonomonadaceae bacterium PH5-43]
MEKNAEFDDIRPFYDEEVPDVIKELLEDKDLKAVIEAKFPQGMWEQLTSVLRDVKTKKDFQHKIIRGGLFEVVHTTVDSIDCGGFENISKENSYIYISNHRDIVLDAALLACMLDTEGFDTMEIAIGDNLLLYPWIKNVVRLNKSFIVKRGINIRQMLEVSTHLSKYIHFAIKEKHESIWIAQREGRAKNSDDKTQESVLKMLAMGGDGDFINNIKELNIAPVSLSYQYDPCDYLKAREFQAKRDNPDYKKTQEEDLLNMGTGISGYKGNVHFQIGKPIASLLNKLDKSKPKNELIADVADIINKEIHRNYKLYPNNYVAYDQLWGGSAFTESYTDKDVESFNNYKQTQLAKIEIENKDIQFLEEKLLEMYAYPVKNYIKATQ